MMMMIITRIIMIIIVSLISTRYVLKLRACGVVYKSNLINCRFLRRGENRSTRGKTSQSREANKQTQPTVCRVWKSNPGHIGGSRVLSPLCHHCSALHYSYFTQFSFSLLEQITSLVLVMYFIDGNYYIP